jgi:aldehyde:ferredoxin oxidoreductase
MATEDVPGFGYPRLGPEIFEPMLDEYYEANGWSLSTSVPTRRKLAELGLADVAAEFEALGIEVEA